MKKTFILFLLIPVLLVACNNKINVTIVNDNPEIGDVTNGGSFTSGSTVILQAKVNKDHEGKNLFTGWYKVENELEEALSFENPYLYTVNDKDIKIKAKWEEYSTKTFTFNYKESTNSYSISLYRDSDENIIIPKTHYGINVDEISGYTFAGLKSAKSIKIEDNIKVIGEYAFMNCNLSIIKLPNNLSTIANNCFYGWTETQTIEIPNNCFMDKSSNRTKWGWNLTLVPSTNYLVDEEGTCGSKLVHFIKID